MLRAAHTSSIHIRLPGNGATSSPGRRSNVSGGRKSGRGAARQSDQQLVSSGNRASGLSKSFLSPSKRSIENLQAEVASTLKCLSLLSILICFPVYLFMCTVVGGSAVCTAVILATAVNTYNGDDSFSATFCVH